MSTTMTLTSLHVLHVHFTEYKRRRKITDAVVMLQGSTCLRTSALFPQITLKCYTENQCIAGESQFDNQQAQRSSSSSRRLHFEAHTVLY
jgi:hypothetical protein